MSSNKDHPSGSARGWSRPVKNKGDIRIPTRFCITVDTCFCFSFQGLKARSRKHFGLAKRQNRFHTTKERASRRH